MSPVFVASANLSSYNRPQRNFWREKMRGEEMWDWLKAICSSGLAGPYKYYGVESWNQPEGLHRAPSNSKAQSHICAFGVCGCGCGAKKHNVRASFNRYRDLFIKRDDMCPICVMCPVYALCHVTIRHYISPCHQFNI